MLGDNCAQFVSRIFDHAVDKALIKQRVPIFKDTIKDYIDIITLNDTPLGLHGSTGFLVFINKNCYEKSHNF